MTAPTPSKSSTPLIDDNDREVRDALSAVGMTLDGDLPVETTGDWGEDDPRDVAIRQDFDLEHEIAVARARGTLVCRLADFRMWDMLDRLSSGDTTPSEVTALVIAGIVVSEVLREMRKGSALRATLERELVAKGELIAGYLGHDSWR